MPTCVLNDHTKLPKLKHELRPQLQYARGKIRLLHIQRFLLTKTLPSWGEGGARDFLTTSLTYSKILERQNSCLSSLLEGK